FPLSLVALPGAAIPLHIFEDRYREMVGEAEATHTDFGIVRTITRGEESGIANVGCTVIVEAVTHRYPDGRFDIVTRGWRRFRILSLDDEKDWLRGEVEYFDDEEEGPVAEEVIEKAFAAYRRLQREVGEGEPETLDRESRDLSFRMAASVDDLDFRSILLQSKSETQRLKLFTDFVEAYIPRRQYIAMMKKKVPTNGAGHKRPGA
ncbi:MAG TPA: LON peptidase substrate-binding domain-containing protein, partial [Bryobacteraceae bacterium]|nr:LON peptidase substrate-binding domain-containing protein [Bryobacteraceae bacterium]